MIERPILGVDASSVAMAYTGSGVLPQGCFETKHKSADYRRLQMYREAKQLASRLPSGTIVALEEPLSLKNAKTNVILGLAAGAVWAGFADKIDVVLVNVAAWKKATVGKGNAKKEQVRWWCLAHNEFNRSPHYFDEHPDLYDAWAIYRYALGELEPGVLK